WGALEAWGMEYFVKASALDWVSSARYGDTVSVDVEVEKLGRTSLTLVFAIRVGARLCCTVRTTYVAAADGRPTPWPDEVRARRRPGTVPRNRRRSRRRGGARSRAPSGPVRCPSGGPAPSPCRSGRRWAAAPAPGRRRPGTRRRR